MKLAQLVRWCGSLLVLGLVGFLIGCSGQEPPPGESGIGKQIRQETKAERKQAVEARKEAAKERAGMKGKR